MYVDVPTNVSAMELISSPETPKSQILTCPFELNRMFEGLISVSRRGRKGFSSEYAYMGKDGFTYHDE